MQFQADILNIMIKVPECLETTALGAAYLAGLKTGYFASLQEIEKNHPYKRVFEAKMTKAEMTRRYSGWKKAVRATREFK
ncbi:Glycerol kinase [bioreactor metagenome]|uniref:Glycerol kinase n=1 Tax=bioreactor metagenome TaxID=1076179 RepID=A0A645IP39_9ZZZZ